MSLTLEDLEKVINSKLSSKIKNSIIENKKIIIDKYSVKKL